MMSRDTMPNIYESKWLIAKTSQRIEYAWEQYQTSSVVFWDVQIQRPALNIKPY